MAVLPTSPSCLELTMSIPGISSYSSLPPSGGCMMRDLDINQVPPCTEEDWTTGSIEDEEESAGGSGGVGVCAGSGVVSGVDGPPRKKLRLTKEQSRFLEESFRQNHTLNPKEKEALAFQLKLRTRQVEVWFQNRRARTKLKQTEMECEYLKRWYGSLTEQNKRLHKEVEELRAMKVGPPTVISPHTCQPLPASTLSMCPSCERVTSSALDKGPTTNTTTTTTVTTTTNISLSYSKASIIHSRQPSAAC